MSTKTEEEELVMALYALGFADDLESVGRAGTVGKWARAILGSPWLAEHDAVVRREALKEAAAVRVPHQEIVDLYWTTTGDDWAVPEWVMVDFVRAVLKRFGVSSVVEGDAKLSGNSVVGGSDE